MLFRSEALPTIPDADSAGPTVATASPAARSTARPESAGRFANVAPEKAPPRPSAPREREKSAPPPTHSSSDQTVMHVRRLQTQLMVGALSCGQAHMQTSYNNFVTKFDHALKANGAALKSYFTRTFGNRGINEMDSFLTKLSNELSLVSMRHTDFCDRTNGLFDTVLALGPSEIEAFADRYLTQPVVARDGF